MITSNEVIKKVKSLRPEIKICVGEDGTYRIVERAIELGCEMVQIYTPDGKNINKEMIDRAHAHGIKVNVFYSDTVEFARELLTMGADTILTNDYLMLSNALGIK
jgi:glycerophosphoryl diester phosphodiesterase